VLNLDQVTVNKSSNQSSKVRKNERNPKEIIASNESILEAPASNQSQNSTFEKKEKDTKDDKFS
jgi:hypothetical protein